jgi:hypothetical protein
MSIITKRTQPLTVNPGLTLLYGSRKAGKTTMLGKLDDCLIVDTERGANFITGDIASMEGLTDLRDLVTHLVGEQSKGNKYKYIALDTLNKIVEWAEEAVVYQHNQANPGDKIIYFGDLSYGKGHALVREKIDKLIDTFITLTDHLILIGHNKLASAVNETSTLVDPASLNLTGKLKNMIMAKCDSIGYVFREDEDSTLKISFKSNSALEAGSRCEHLKGKVLDFKWENIFK